MSPGTSWSIGNETRPPSRRTVTCTATERRSAATASCARISWTKSREMLSNTMAAMMTKLATSPVAAESALASSRMMINGLANRARNCSTGGRRLSAAASLGPYIPSRCAAEAASRPASVVASSASSPATGLRRTSVAPGAAGFAAIRRGGAYFIGSTNSASDVIPGAARPWVGEHLHRRSRLDHLARIEAQTEERHLVGAARACCRLRVTSTIVTLRFSSSIRFSVFRQPLSAPARLRARDRGDAAHYRAATLA